MPFATFSGFLYISTSKIPYKTIGDKRVTIGNAYEVSPGGALPLYCYSVFN